MLSLGIDFDTTTWRVAAWDEDRAADLHTFDSVEEVWEFVDALRSLHPATPLVLPSGFGVPVTRVTEIMDQDIFEMTLEPRWQSTDTLGRFLAEARRRALRAYCIPAVKLLPSVSPHRKLNRVDLGTSDVLCAAVWAIHCLSSADHSRRTCDFVLLHTRPGTRSLLAVQAGQVVDGIGSSTGRLEPGQSEPLCALAPGLAQDQAVNRATSASDRMAGYSREARCEALQKEVFGLLFESDLAPEEIVEQRGLRQMTDSNALEAIVTKLIADNPAAVQDYRNGATKAIGFLVGQAMRLSHGKANPKLVRKMIETKLSSQ